MTIIYKPEHKDEINHLKRIIQYLELLERSFDDDAFTEEKAEDLKQRFSSVITPADMLSHYKAIYGRRVFESD